MGHVGHESKCVTHCHLCMDDNLRLSNSAPLSVSSDDRKVLVRYSPVRVRIEPVSAIPSASRNRGVAAHASRRCETPFGPGRCPPARRLGVQPLRDALRRSLCLRYGAADALPAAVAAAAAVITAAPPTSRLREARRRGDVCQPEAPVIT